jgi:hypothetical protein
MSREISARQQSMESEPSFLSRLFEFGSALLPSLLVLVTSGFGPAVIIAFAAKYQDRCRLLKPIANRTARPWIILVIFAIGFAYASFSAFDDVNSRLRAAQKEVTEAKNKGSVEQQRAIDKLGTDLASAQRQNRFKTEGAPQRVASARLPGARTRVAARCRGARRDRFPGSALAR